MCGIVGYFHMNGLSSMDASSLARMTDALIHRGPDDVGFYRTSIGGLGFRRLGIIDLAGGNQPLLNEDNSVAMVCNGEIFNFHELRSSLESKGHIFRTQTDVEVLVHLYEDYGVEMLNMINGQFAFALLDLKSQSLFLARDHVGVAPLYYTQAGGLFLFGSEIKAILEHSSVTRQVNVLGLDQLFAYPGLVSPYTMFENIHSVRPGHYMVVSLSKVQESEYWDLNYPELTHIYPVRNETGWIDEISYLLSRSVQYRLQADVPVGFYLSGGLDSSLLAALICQAQPETLFNAFAVTFDERHASESSYQRKMARHLKCLLHETHFDSNRTADLMRQMIFHAETPVKETYNACCLELSKLAHQAGLKVILTGEGADELFAGYVGYRMDRARGEGIYNIPLTAEGVIEQAMRKTLWGDAHIFYEQDYDANKQKRRALYSSHVCAAINDQGSEAEPLIDQRKLRNRHPVHQRSYLDFKLRLSDHLLMDHGDKMALAHSVEARYPFLDIDFIQCATQLPPGLKLKGYTEKYILRRVAESHIPADIAWREKFGWFAPGSPEMLQAKAEWICDMLSDETIRQQGYFNPQAIRKLRDTYSQPGFHLNKPFDTDWLIIVATFGLFKTIFDLPNLS